jgi:hypothetical protein
MLLYYMQQLPSPGFATLIKGKQHKYIKREPTGRPKPKWRYWYRLPQGKIVHDQNVKTGAKFRHGKGDDQGHYEVVGTTDDGKIKIKHDETGHESTVTQKELERMIHGGDHALGESVQKKTERLLNTYKQALKTGTAKQKANAKKRLLEHVGSYGSIDDELVTVGDKKIDSDHIESLSRPEQEPAAQPERPSSGRDNVNLPKIDRFVDEHTVDDYPYGRQRTEAKFFIETKRGKQRIGKKTKNPRTGAWNAPKYTTYGDKAKLAIGDDGHVYYVVSAELQQGGQITTYDATGRHRGTAFGGPARGSDDKRWKELYEGLGYAETAPEMTQEQLDDAASGVLAARWNQMKNEGWVAKQKPAGEINISTLPMLGPLPLAKVQQILAAGVVLEQKEADVPDAPQVEEVSDEEKRSRRRSWDGPTVRPRYGMGKFGAITFGDMKVGDWVLDHTGATRQTGHITNVENLPRGKVKITVRGERADGAVYTWTETKVKRSKFGFDPASRKPEDWPHRASPELSEAEAQRRAREIELQDEGRQYSVNMINGYFRRNKPSSFAGRGQTARYTLSADMAEVLGKDAGTEVKATDLSKQELRKLFDLLVHRRSVDEVMGRHITRSLGTFHTTVRKSGPFTTFVR